MLTSHIYIYLVHICIVITTVSELEHDEHEGKWVMSV